MTAVINPDRVESYRKNPKALGWFVGQVMKATHGQANPQLVNEVLKKRSWRVELLAVRCGLC